MVVQNSFTKDNIEVIVSYDGTFEALGDYIGKVPRVMLWRLLRDVPRLTFTELGKRLEQEVL